MNPQGLSESSNSDDEVERLTLPSYLYSSKLEKPVYTERKQVSVMQGTSGVSAKQKNNDTLKDSNEFERNVCPRIDSQNLGCSNWRGSRVTLLAKVGINTSSPSARTSRSLSIAAPRNITRDGGGLFPKSPTSTKKFLRSSLMHSSSVPTSPVSFNSRKPFSGPDSKLVVLGAPSVGKSAVVVRLLTGRFIWEYDPTLEAVYRYNTVIDDDPALIEVLDTAGMTDGSVNEVHAKWGDGFLIVYSLTDRYSFQAVADIHKSLASYKHTSNFPCVLVGNKVDLTHMSKVSEKEALVQASELGVSYFSASACEGSPAIHEAFSELHRDVVRRCRSFGRRKSSAKGVIEGFYKMFSR